MIKRDSPRAATGPGAIRQCGPRGPRSRPPAESSPLRRPRGDPGHRAPDGAHQGGDRPLGPHHAELGARPRPAPRGGAARPLPAATICASLGETVGGLAHNFNNSLAAILAYTELMLRDEPNGVRAQRRLMVMRDVALEASATVRRLQEFVSRQPQVAFGPVGLPAVIAEAARADRAALARRGASGGASPSRSPQDMEALPPVEGNAFELRDALVRLILNAVDAMPRRGRAGHPGRRRGVGLGGRRGARHGRGDAGGAASAPRRARAEPRSRARGEPRARRGRRHRRAPRRQREHRERGRQGDGRSGCACTRAASRSSPPPRGWPSAVRAGARRARAPRGRRPAARSPCSPTCCAGEGHAVTTAAKGEEALEVFDPRRARRGHHRSRHAAG